ncbi:MAG: hypothetical protein WC071_11780, partial [Victivallaceae bacterium]
MLWSCHNFHDRKMLPHRHDMHELFFCLNDNGMQYIGGENCEFRRGRAFFLFNGIEHYLEHQPEAPGEFVFFCFDPNHF